MIHDDLTEQIIGAAIEVHRHWGPGLNEDLYQRSLCRELELQGIQYEQQVRQPLIYKGEKVGDELKLDVWVDKKVVLELKQVAKLLPVHEAQLLTYMRLTGSRVGLLINFNVTILKDAIKRMVF